MQNTQFNEAALVMLLRNKVRSYCYTPVRLPVAQTKGICII